MEIKNIYPNKKPNEINYDYNNKNLNKNGKNFAFELTNINKQNNSQIENENDINSPRKNN